MRAVDCYGYYIHLQENVAVPLLEIMLIKFLLLGEAQIIVYLLLWRSKQYIKL